MPPSHQKLTSQPGPKALAAIFEQCNIKLSSRQIEQFWLYHDLLRRYNRLLNLTRIHNFNNMVLKLYVDSILPATLMKLPSPLMDLGTGPGMPGIPLKIFQPDLEIHLAEGRAKRVAFLQQAVAELEIKNVHIIQRKIVPAFNQPMAAVITRAVETIDQTLERVEGCLQQNGQMIFMKGPECDAEIEKALTRFGHRFALIEDRPYRIGQTENLRRLVVFKRSDVPVHIRAKLATRRHRISIVASETNVRFKAMKKLLSSRGIKKASQALMCGQRQVQDMITRFPDRCLVWISSGENNPPPENGPENMQWLQLTEALFQQLDIFGTRNALLCIQVPPILPWEAWEGFMPGCNLLVPFQDPENIGAVIRCAAAFGVAQVIVLAESAHPYHPKSLRTSGGTVPCVELRLGPPLADLPDTLPILALSAEGTDIGETRFPASFGLLAGLEGQGVPNQWREKALRIPIQPCVESLNAAAAVAIALYEWSQSVGNNS